jgi:ribosome biogenesis protein Nip4
MAPYAKYKVWVKPSSELSWMYGNSLLKVRRIGFEIVLCCDK